MTGGDGFVILVVGFVLGYAVASWRRHADESHLSNDWLHDARRHGAIRDELFKIREER